MYLIKILKSILVFLNFLLRREIYWTLVYLFLKSGGKAGFENSWRNTQLGVKTNTNHSTSRGSHTFRDRLCQPLHIPSSLTNCWNSDVFWEWFLAVSPGLIALKKSTYLSKTFAAMSAEVMYFLRLPIRFFTCKNPPVVDLCGMYELRSQRGLRNLYMWVGSILEPIVWIPAYVCRWARVGAG